MRFPNRGLLLLLVSLACAATANAQETAPSKRVLVLMPFQVSRPGSVALLRGMEDGLRASYPGSVEMVTDSVAPVPPEPDAFPEKMSDWLAYKYGHQHFDAVVSVINPPIPYAVALRDRFWPDAPILLVLQEEERKRFPQAVYRSSQVVAALSNTETLRSALRMLPETEHLVYLGGDSDQDRRANALILGNIRQAFPKLDITEIQGLTWEETKDRVRSLPAGSMILIGSFLFDRNHRQLSVPQQAEELSMVVSVPIIADSDVSVGKGVVGGSVLSVHSAGMVAGEQLAALLTGADPDHLPSREVKNSFIVDWRQLQRWRIPESRLPADAAILYKPPTAWEQYKTYIVTFAVVLILLSAAVAFLLFERQRRRKEERLNSAMLDSLPGLAMLLGPEGKILRANHINSGPSSTGLKASSPVAIGQPYQDYLRNLTAHDDGFGTASLIEDVITGRQRSATTELALPSGAGWIELRAIQLPHPQSGTLVVHLDITQRKQAELERTRSRTEIFHLNRVAAMGQLAASLAHELSQPLAAIMSNAEAAQRFASRPNPDMKEVCEALDDIARDDKRAGAVIQGMRAMLKKDSLKLEPVDLNQTASDVARLLRNEASLRGMEIHVELHPAAVMVLADPVALQQVVLNLASNGLDAMNDVSGERLLTIRTECHNEGQYGTIYVEDQGPGINADLREKLFQPFFTTKSSGLGMGLSICQSILDSLGGRIDLKSNNGEGALFAVDLPLA